MTRKRHYIPDTRRYCSYRLLALDVIQDAIISALKGSEPAREWLYDSAQVRRYCDLLGEDYRQLIANFEACQRAGKKKRRVYFSS